MAQVRRRPNQVLITERRTARDDTVALDTNPEKKPLVKPPSVSFNLKEENKELKDEIDLLKEENKEMNKKISELENSLLVLTETVQKQQRNISKPIIPPKKEETDSDMDSCDSKSSNCEPVTGNDLKNLPKEWQANVQNKRNIFSLRKFR